MAGRLFADLYLDGVVEGEDHVIRQLVIDDRRSLKAHICDVRWTYAAVGVTLLASAGLVITGLGGVWEATPHIGFNIWLGALIGLPFAAVVMYMLCMIVAKQIAIIHSLYRFFTEGSSENGAGEVIVVRPWHLDRCGGLGRLNRYSIRFSYLIAIFGFGLLLIAYLSIRNNGFMGSLTTEPIVWFAIVVYVVLAPVVFLLTLGSAHRAMVREKSQHLRAISEQLDTEYRKARSTISADSPLLAAAVEKVKRLQELYELTAKFPTWPVDVTAVRRFATAAIAAPPITAAVPFAIERAVEPVAQMRDGTKVVNIRPGSSRKSHLNALNTELKSQESALFVTRLGLCNRLSTFLFGLKSPRSPSP